MVNKWCTREVNVFYDPVKSKQHKETGNKKKRCSLIGADSMLLASISILILFQKIKEKTTVWNSEMIKNI